ncbi:FAD-binding oxidoreductase [Antrihabitans sp. YC3-6]|uniref:FAD-binding oxidoreductase n=1 Tax=Antrihabitans stalagmiti TaxID=2799499 RepID=A0A934NTR8_9NOCA|nr:FAD-binding oxidoreductase [Antrihabitans stalagmiti]MBJ8341149.1 FAD-binding oxidoreductase [Antrihabitans stalagmiti]
MSTHIDDPQALRPHTVVERLRQVVAGEVHAPGTGGYDIASATFNVATEHRPAAVVVAADAADVAATVRVAAASGLTVAVQATGHGAIAAKSDAILINTSRLSKLSIDVAARTATVGAGVRWQKVLDATSPFGLGGLCGSAPDAGVVGYTLGGGMGPIARTYGFAADHVVELEVVSADGSISRVDESTDPDLFWAIRGGGAAFGIVTEMTFRLFPLTTLHAGGLFFDIVDAPRVLRGWREWVHMIPESVSTSVAVLNLPPLPDLPEVLRGRTVLHVRYATADRRDEYTSIIGAIRALATPLLDTVSDIHYADLGAIHADPTDPMPVSERGMLLAELPVEAIDTFFATVGPDAELPIIMAEIRAMGGALARDAETPNAVAGRTAAFAIFTLGMNVPPIADAVVGALDSILSAMAPWGTGGALMNFAGAVTGEPVHRVHSAWGVEKYTRLREIRERVDPKGVFAAAARW